MIGKKGTSSFVMVGFRIFYPNLSYKGVSCFLIYHKAVEGPQQDKLKQAHAFLFYARELKTPITVNVVVPGNGHKEY